MVFVAALTGRIAVTQDINTIDVNFIIIRQSQLVVFLCACATTPLHGGIYLSLSGRSKEGWYDPVYRGDSGADMKNNAVSIVPVCSY